MNKKLLLIPVVFASLSALFGCSNKETSGYHENTVKVNYSGEGYHDSNPIPGDYADDHMTSETDESITVGTYGSADPLFDRGVGEIKITEEIGGKHVISLSMAHEKLSSEEILEHPYVSVGVSTAYGFVYLDEKRTTYSPVFLQLDGNSYKLNVFFRNFLGYSSTIERDNYTYSFYFNGRKIDYSPNVVITNGESNLEKYQQKYGVYVAHNIGLKGIAEMIYYSPFKLGRASTTDELYAWAYSEVLDEVVRFDYGEVYYFNRNKATWLELHHMAEQLGGVLCAPYNFPSQSFVKVAFENNIMEYGFKKYDSDLYIGLFYKHGDTTNVYRLDNGNSLVNVGYPNSQQSDQYFDGKLYPDTNLNARFLKMTKIGDDYVSLNVDGIEKLNGMFKFPSLEAIGNPIINPYYEG